LPPDFAARLRAGVLALLRELLLLRAVVDLRAEELPLPEDLRADDPLLRELLLRDAEVFRAEVLREEDFRADDDPPPDDLREDPPERDDPPPLLPELPLESAILVPPPRLCTRQDYATLKRASTGA
jgi:hypothetical protein